MNRKLISTLFLMMLMAAIMLSASVARADILLTLNPATLSGYPGDTLTFNATITNTGPSEVFLNGITDNVSAPLTLDDSLFFTTPASLAAGDFWTGNLFTVTIPASAVPYFTGSGYVTLVGGADSSAQDVLSTQTFEVNVVPEPASMVLLGSGLSGLVGVIRRKRQK